MRPRPSRRRSRDGHSASRRSGCRSSSPAASRSSTTFSCSSRSVGCAHRRRSIAGQPSGRERRYPRRVGEQTTSDTRHLDRDWRRQRLEVGRRESNLLGEIREALFGMQDGLVSTLAVVSTVGGATGERYPIVVAGIASALAGVFSMAAGEYLSSKSQREIYLAQIDNERDEVRDRPAEAEAEVAFLLESEGLSSEAARRVAGELAREPNVLLKTMVEKELGLVVDEGHGPLQGAIIMGASFGLASLVPIVPFLLLSASTAIWASLILSGLVVFGIGVVKTRWTRRNPIGSGLEVVALAAFAGIAGYFFGSLLPGLLGGRRISKKKNRGMDLAALAGMEKEKARHDD